MANVLWCECGNWGTDIECFSGPNFNLMACPKCHTIAIVKDRNTAYLTLQNCEHPKNCANREFLSKGKL